MRLRGLCWSWSLLCFLWTEPSCYPWQANNINEGITRGFVRVLSIQSLMVERYHCQWQVNFRHFYHQNAALEVPKTHENNGSFHFQAQDPRSVRARRSRELKHEYGYPTFKQTNVERQKIAGSKRRRNDLNKRPMTFHVFNEIFPVGVWFEGAIIADDK